MPYHFNRFKPVSLIYRINNYLFDIVLGKKGLQVGGYAVLFQSNTKCLHLALLCFPYAQRLRLVFYHLHNADTVGLYQPLCPCSPKPVYTNTTQKCYMADTGLLVTHTFKDKKYTDNELYRAILFDKLNINEGMLMENIVAQMLRLRRERLYFYSRSDSRKRENHMEIDFLITEGKKIAPVEVKSGNYRSHSSLDKFRKHFSSVIGNSYILYTKDVMIKDGIIHLPLYMAEFL